MSWILNIFARVDSIIDDLKLNKGGLAHRKLALLTWPIKSVKQKIYIHETGMIKAERNEVSIAL